MNKDIRWIQRFENFKAAFDQLSEAVALSEKRELSQLEKQGLIQAFEFTHELAWNVLKDYFEYQGNFSIRGSRDATREGFKYSLINDGKIWMRMIETRNLSSHTYDKQIAEDIITVIINEYFAEFCNFKRTMKELVDN